MAHDELADLKSYFDGVKHQPNPDPSPENPCSNIYISHLDFCNAILKKIYYNIASSSKLFVPSRKVAAWKKLVQKVESEYDPQQLATSYAPLSPSVVFVRSSRALMEEVKLKKWGPLVDECTKRY